MMKSRLPAFIHRLDIFGESVPAFNIDGEAEIKTSMGAVSSILIFMLTFTFGLIKFQNLLNRKNPSVVGNLE